MLKSSHKKEILTVVLLIIGVSASYIAYGVKMSMPNVNGSVYSKDVFEEVEIVRDQYGIPNIKANNMHDLFYAQGYIHAQDRLYQMLSMKHLFLGRLSEVFGKRTIGADKYMRYLNTEGSAQASYEQLSPETKEMLVAYAKGVNRYIDENRQPLELKLVKFPVEYWRPQDCLVIQKAMAFDLSRDWPMIIKNTYLAETFGNAILEEVYPYEVISEPSVLDQDLIKEKLPYSKTIKEYPDGPEIPEGLSESYIDFARLSHAVLAGLSSDGSAEAGSNIWAVRDTDTGKPYIASDPHLSYRIPNMLYMVHMTGGGLELMGSSIPGAPGIIIGRNKDIAWGFTNGRLAQSDVFYAKEIAGKVERLETIKVSKGQDIEVMYYDTDYGVLISSEDAEYDVAMNWTGFLKPDLTLDAVYGFNRASSVSEVKEYIKHFHTPAQNFVVADRTGQYGFFALGHVPQRKHSGRIAVPAIEEYRWKEGIPSSEMPRVENPKRGYVMNANNEVVSRHYGHNATRLEFDNLRAIRLADMLKDKKVFTQEDMEAIQLDNQDQKWILMRDTLLNAVPESDQARQALAALKKWDGQAIKNSYEITIFSVWMHKISSKIYQEISTGLPRWAKPQYSDLFVRNSIQENGRSCLLHSSCAALLTSTLEETVVELTGKYGQDMTNWRWEKSHQALFTHQLFKKIPILKQLSTRTVKINGARDTLNRSRWYSNKNGFQAIEGACLRMVASLNSDKGDFSIPMGESGHIFSEHYDDLLAIWARGEYVSLPSDSSKDVLVIKPSA